MLRMMGPPSRLAGLKELHKFLHSGFVIFKKMDGAAEFLGTIVGRETVLMNRLFDGAPDPFNGLAQVARE
jgi:hypothetical protein